VDVAFSGTLRSLATVATDGSYRRQTVDGVDAVVSGALHGLAIVATDGSYRRQTVDGTAIQLHFAYDVHTVWRHRLRPKFGVFSIVSS